MTKSPPPPPAQPRAGLPHEKRRHERVELLAQVEVTRDREVHILAARNASLGGLYLEGAPGEHPDLIPGVVVRVVLFAPEDGTERLQAEATIVRIDPGVAHVRPAGFGLMWRTLDPAAAEQLSALLARR